LAIVLQRAVLEDFAPLRFGEVESLVLYVGCGEVDPEQVSDGGLLEVSDLASGEETIALVLEPPAVSVAGPLELVSDDAGGGGSDNRFVELLSDDGGVEVQVVDFSVQRPQFLGRGGVLGEQQPASKSVGSGGGLAGGVAVGGLVHAGVLASVPQLADGVVVRDSTVGSTHLVLDGDISVGTETDGAELFGELEIDCLGTLEQEGVEHVLGLSVFGHLVGGHENGGTLSRAGSVAGRVERGAATSVLEGVRVGDGGVTETEGESEKLRGLGVYPKVVAVVVSDEFTELGLAQESGEVLVQDDGLVLGDVLVPGELEDLLIGPRGVLCGGLAGNALVLAEEQSVEGVQTVVLSVAGVSGGEETLGELVGDPGDELGGDGDVGATWVGGSDGIDVVNEGHPLAVGSAVCGVDCCAEAWGSSLEGSVVNVVAGLEQSTGVGAQQLGDVLLFSIHDVQVQVGSGFGSDLKATVHEISAGTKNAHSGASTATTIDGGSLGEKAVVTLFNWDEVEDGGVCASTWLVLVQSIVTHTVDSLEVVGNELTHEHPVEVEAILLELVFVGAENLVGDGTHVGGENGVTVGSVGPFDSLGSSPQILSTFSPRSEDGVVTFTRNSSL
jgi:hypothetical protein